MYILDEIDAALDLQHTQHIGQLFRNRFKGSQFIVVSLKEGLFTNANVLFRARFRDGTSIVEVSLAHAYFETWDVPLGGTKADASQRTERRSQSSMYSEDKENRDEQSGAGQGKGKGRTGRGAVAVR